MKPFRYRIVLEWSDEDAAFLARVPALPGCAAHGKTAEEAAREARRAAGAMLAVLREDGDLMVTLLAERSGLSGVPLRTRERGRDSRRMPSSRAR